MSYGPSFSEDELRSRVRERIADGRLPVVLSMELFAGTGTGHPCQVCDENIVSEHVEYESTDPHTGSQLTFHLTCHSVWRLECLRRVQASH